MVIEADMGCGSRISKQKSGSLGVKSRPETTESIKIDLQVQVIRMARISTRSRRLKARNPVITNKLKRFRDEKYTDKKVEEIGYKDLNLLVKEIGEKDLILLDEEIGYKDLIVLV